MDIQEFSRQLGRDDQASRLIHALRQLRGLDLAAFRGLDLSRLGWPTWPDFAGLPEPRR